MPLVERLSLLRGSVPLYNCIGMYVPQSNVYITPSNEKVGKLYVGDGDLLQSPVLSYGDNMDSTTRPQAHTYAELDLKVCVCMCML